jgi:hypothetical protein
MILIIKLARGTQSMWRAVGTKKEKGTQKKGKEKEKE